MTLHTHAGSLPTHQYVWIEPRAIGDHGWLRAVWFGLASFPGRAWGCHVLLESGAVYRNVPLHQLASTYEPDEPWTCHLYKSDSAYKGNNLYLSGHKITKQKI